MTEEPVSRSCAQCRYFHRHYVRTGNHRYFPLEQGHCSHPSCRDKKADAPACNRFSKRREPSSGQ